jgi:hypothetical protein
VTRSFNAARTRQVAVVHVQSPPGVRDEENQVICIRRETAGQKKAKGKTSMVKDDRIYQISALLLTWEVLSAKEASSNARMPALAPDA